MKGVNMFDLELVTVQQDGKPYRYTERVANGEIAMTTANALVRRMSGEASVGMMSMGTAIVYATEAGIVGYANIDEVVGE